MKVIIEKIGNARLMEMVGRLFDRMAELGEGLPRMVGGTMMMGESPRVVRIVNLNNVHFMRKIVGGSECLFLGAGLFLWLIAAYYDMCLGKERVVLPSGINGGEQFRRGTVSTFHWGTVSLVVGLLVIILEAIVDKLISRAF